MAHQNHIKKTSESNKEVKKPSLAELRRQHTIVRWCLVAGAMFIFVVCLCVRNCRQLDQRVGLEREQATIDSIRAVRDEEQRERWAEQSRQRAIENQRRQVSIAALPKVEIPEPEQPKKPKYTWNDLENMVRSLTNENYYASVWQEDGPKWVVIYHKGGRDYLRTMNVEKRTFGPVVRVIRDKQKTSDYSVAGNKRKKYYRDGAEYVYEVNGVEKQRYSNFHTIDLFTPEPAPDGYEDWEDYYYDNEEDLYFYYGGR